MKANSIIGVTHNADGTITFQAVGAGSFVFDPAKCHQAINEQARLQGFVTRISNGAALSKDQTTGASATPEEKRARMEAIARHLETSDTWAMRSAGPRVKAFDVGAVVMGLIRAKVGQVVDVDSANALLAATATKRNISREDAARVWAGSREVAQAMADILAEAAPAGAEELLAELVGVGE